MLMSTMFAFITEITVLFLKLIYCYLEALFRLIVPKSRRDIRWKIVLITGGGHGIGRELALEFARLGTKLVLLDINKVNNESVAEEVKEVGAEVHTYTCDVSSLEDIRKTSQLIKQQVGTVDILVNNAGILYGGPLLDLQEKHIQKCFEVNVLAQFWMVKSFLPEMLQRNDGIIMNIASATAKRGSAFLTDYSATKFAVYGFSEALSEELQRLGKPGIQVTVVCPIFTDTGMTKFPKDRFGKLLTPKETAMAAVDGMLRGDKYIYIPSSLLFACNILLPLLPQRGKDLVYKFAAVEIDPQYRHKKE